MPANCMREIGGQLGEWSNVPRIRENFAWRSFNVLLLSGMWRQSHRHAQGRQRPGRPRAAFRQRRH